MKFINLVSYSILFICFFTELNAQKIWTKTDHNTFELDILELNTSLKNISKEYNSFAIINFPNEKGILTPYKVIDNSLLPENLASKYPNIHAYKGVNTTNPNSSITLTYTPNNISGTIINGVNIWSLQQLENTNLYRVLNDSEALGMRINCGNDQSNIPSSYNASPKVLSDSSSSGKTLVGDNTLRILKTAITVTGEYSDYFINKFQLESSNDATKKAAVLSGIVASLNNLNTVFERDLGIRFELIENNDELIFLDKNTDPYLTNDSNDLIDTGFEQIINVTALEDFDIGHVLSVGFAGLAEIAGLCNRRKGQAVSAGQVPEGTEFDFTLFAHELGHQLGATHTQNYTCQRTNITAMEPGSGSTIMGYAGACDRFVEIQSTSDEYFHLVSINQIRNHIQSVSCGIETEVVSNSLPVIEFLPDYSIPANTNFILEANVTDSDNDPLTYCWEQLDNELATMPPVSTSSVGPLFRSLLPNSSPSRNFPEQYNVNTKWEVLPTVSREMNFGLTVRDGNPGGIISSNLTISVINTGEQFSIIAPSLDTNYAQNSIQDVEWEIAGTDSNGIDTEFVKIELSYDNGLTYPVVLTESTPNDGIENVTIPSGQASELCLFKITPINNIYYAISESPFIITEEVSTTLNIIDREILTEISKLKISEYALYDLSGSMLISKKSKSNIITFETISSDISYFTTGIYILKVEAGSQVHTVKIIKE